MCRKLHNYHYSDFLIYTGDIVNVLSTEYLCGRISDYSKITFIVFDYDPRDKHYQIYYKDDVGQSWQIWLPDSAISFKWSYNFYLKREKLIKILQSKRQYSVQKAPPDYKKLRDALNEGKFYW